MGNKYTSEVVLAFDLIQLQLIITPAKKSIPSAGITRLTLASPIETLVYKRKIEQRRKESSIMPILELVAGAALRIVRQGSEPRARAVDSPVLVDGSV